MGERQRIVFLNNQGLGTIGGGVTLLRHLAEDLARDHDVAIASYDIPVGHRLIEEIQLPAPGEPGRFWRLAPFRRALHLRRVVPPALIAHADCIIALDCTFASLFARRLPGGPRLVHLALSCTPAQERVGGADPLSVWQYARLEGRLARAADEVIVSSRAQAAEMARECRLRGRSPTVLYPTLPGPPPTCPPPNIDEPCTILCAGRLVPGKRFDEALRLLATLQDLAWRLVIAGDGPERPALQALAAELGIAERVRFAGNVDTIAPLLADSLLLMHPSRYESFGMVMFEAMNAGRPVIAAGGAAVIGFHEVIDHRPAGTLFTDFDHPAEAREALRRLITDPGLRMICAQAAYGRAQELLATSYRAEFRRVAGLIPAPVVRPVPQWASSSGSV